jgi:serine/threonine protein phosphatase PrpC
MDKEVIAWNENVLEAKCRCKLQLPECVPIGSTTVVSIVTSNKIIVAKWGDSRAVLCRNDKPVPLSSDHMVSFRMLTVRDEKKEKEERWGKEHWGRWGQKRKKTH